MPDSVVHAVEDVEEHWANIARRCPIERRIVIVRVVRCICANIDIGASVGLLESVATSPDYEGEDEQRDPSALCAHASPKVFQVQQVAKDCGPNHLKEPVQDAVERPGASVKLHEVDVVEVVGIEPIGGEEHWEEQDYVWIREKSLPKTEQFGLPCWVLHENDFAPVAANDVVGPSKSQCEQRAAERQDEEADICAIIDC